VTAIFTRPESGPYPYYPLNNLAACAREKGLPVFENFTWNEVIKTVKDNPPDLLLVSTFHRIIPEEVLTLAPRCVNLHPSLLPKYRGATPIDWVLFNKEKETGITAHYLTAGVDEGDILIQSKLAITLDDNKSSLLRKLSDLAAQVTRELIAQIKNNSLKPRPQDNSQATSWPKFNPNER